MELKLSRINCQFPFGKQISDTNLTQVFTAKRDPVSRVIEGN